MGRVKEEKRLEKEKIIISFMFPVTSGVMGGVQMLLINLIPYIVKNKLADVRLYDYSFGLVKQKLDEKKVSGYEFISLDDSDWRIPNKGDEVFILTGGLWLSYPHFFKVKERVKVVVWDVYYPYWQSLGKIKGINIPFFKKNALELLSKKNGVFFMEQKGLDFFHDNNLMLEKKDDVIVPVPVYSKNKNKYLETGYAHQRCKEKLTIAYVGRAVDWKMNPVIKLVEDLSAFKISAKLIIYTNDGECFSDFVSSSAANVRIEFKEGYWGEKLEQDLFDNSVTIGYAMGTAALDLANLGIPTILADFSIKKFPEAYKYRFLYQTSKGNLGIDVSEADFEDRYTFKDILGELDLDELSHKSYKYVKSNHNIDLVAKNLILVTKNANLELNYLKNFGSRVYLKLYLLKRILKKNNKYFGWGIM